MKNAWLQTGSEYRLSDSTQQHGSLPPGVYVVNYDQRRSELYLSRTADGFQLPAKVYGGDDRFVDRVVKTYQSTSDNLGVMLNGVKGSGKTVAARMVCERLKLPVLVIREKHDDLPDFINRVKQEVVVFLDEYEKIYKYDDSMLTVMDGVLSGEHRRVFLLTTNDLHVSDSILSRPSRVRYVKTYVDLDLPTITEVVNDTLQNKDMASATIEYLSQLKSITMDVVIQTVREVNIHGEPPSAFADVFNTRPADDLYEVLRALPDGGLKVVQVKAVVSPARLGPTSVGQLLRVNGRHMGDIRQVSVDQSTGDISVVFSDEDADDAESTSVTYVMRKHQYTHYSFT